MKINWGNIATDLAVGAEVVTEAEVDVAQIAAGQPATISIGPVGGSIDGHAVQISGTITLTPA